MRLDLQPDGATELLPFQECSLKALDSCEFGNAHAGVSEDGSLAWIYRGSVLEVINTATGLRVTCLSVAQQLRDEQAEVVCVQEFQCQGRTRLLVGINGTLEEGKLVLLDVASSLVVKSVRIPHQVICLAPVLAYGGSNVPRWALSEQLRHFYGVVAVGTQKGYVYLVDMCLDTPGLSESLHTSNSSLLQIVNLRDQKVADIRKKALAAGNHLALLLGEDEQIHSNEWFHFRKPDLVALQSFKEDEVQVTSLKYIPQSGSLAIGYSFGGFHLWKLRSPVLEYTSNLEPEDLPVAYFLYQEPENDPKNFAYVWVARDDKLSEQKQESLCSISLYQLCYARKTFYASYGTYYEELNAVLLRMEHNLTCDPYNSRNTTTWSSQLIAAYTITDPNYRPPASLTINDSFEEGCQAPDLSLCAFAWEAQDSRPGGTADTFFAIFDMNRWYHAQMPSKIKCSGVMGRECCPYFAVYQLSDVVQREGYGLLQDVHMKPGSLLRFVNNSPMPPEQHFYPSSLAFDTFCVFTNGLTRASFLGVQRQVLANLEAVGPKCLLQPGDFYHRCIQCGLLPRSPDTPTSLSLEEHQRSSVLTMALEQGRLRFITACVRCWADGEFVHQGCTLQFLLAWAWDRVTAIKQQIDVTCRPLYDWSGVPVDQRMLQVLHSCLCSLAHLRTVLYQLLTQSLSVTDQGQAELEHRIQVVTLLHHYLKLVLWFVHNGLLPEHDEAGEPSLSHYIYPASELTQVFRNRRAEMKKLQSKADTHQMILIDALVHSTETAISQLWEEYGSGQYPPPTLQAALSMYLMDNVSESTKDAVMLYLLFDMAAVAHGHQEEFAEKIPLFAKAFELPLGLVHQVHGFWLIDHMNFEEGLTQLLLRQGSSQDLGRWQHRCILNALLSQGETAGAARYLSARNPPVMTVEDVAVRLSVLVANRLVWQAVAYVRSTCGLKQQEDMLKHIFQCCQQRKLMELLFELPLLEKEEQCLQEYLSENVDATLAELLVLHLLQRAQYVPAIRLNERMRRRATMDMSAKARDRTKTRNMIVEGFRHSLPATQQYLINNPPAAVQTSITRKITVPRPKPLSTVVTKRAEARVNCQSSLVMAVMDKVVEAGQVLAQEEAGAETVDVRTVPQETRAESETLDVNDPGPFLCTPTMSRLRSRLSMSGRVVYPLVKSAVTPGLSASFSSPLSSQLSRRSKVFTADCMSLLQTPKIDHTPAAPASPLRRATTPHSILKVTRVPHSSPLAKVSKSYSIEAGPKRLGFEGSVEIPSVPSTPTSLSPSSTPSPTSDTPPAVDASSSGIPSTSGTAAASSSSSCTLISTSSVMTTIEDTVDNAATPKHLRFASPEIQVISPPYVSPDNLARPPLRAASEGGSPPNQGETPPDDDDDDEITFNFDRNQTGSQRDSLSNASTSTQSSLSAAEATPHTSTASPTTTSVAEKDEPHSSQQKPGKRRERSSRPVTPVSPRNSRSKLRGRSSPSPPASITEESESLTSLSQQERAETYRSYRMQTRVKVRSGGQTMEQSVTETTVVIESEDPIPVIEFEDHSGTPEAINAAALETLEPSEEAAMEAVRMALVPDITITDDSNNNPQMVEISDDEMPDLEIQAPTPIRRTPHQVRSGDVDRPSTSRFMRRKDRAPTSEVDEKVEPTPPKLQRVSPARETETPAEGKEGPEAPAPGPFNAGTAHFQDRNENQTAAVLYTSPSQGSAVVRADILIPEGSADQKTTPTALTVHTESSTDDMMPPPPSSPSRHSTRLGTPEQTAVQRAQTATHITRSMDRERKLSELQIEIPVENSDIGTDSSRLPDSTSSTDTERAESHFSQQIKEEDVPKSPSRRSSRRAKTPEIAVIQAESLTTRRSRRRSNTPDTTQASPVLLSPGRRKSHVQKKTPEPSPERIEAPVSPSRRSSRLLRTEQGVSSERTEAPLSPSRSSGSSRTDQLVTSPARQEAPISPSRRSSRLSRVNEDLTSLERTEAPAPVSPSRRSSRLSKADQDLMSLEKTEAPVSPSRKSLRSSKSDQGRATPERTEAALSPSRRSSRLSKADQEQTETPVSPSRRSVRLSRTDQGVTSSDSSAVESLASPARRSMRLSVLAEHAFSEDSPLPKSSLSPGRSTEKAVLAEPVASSPPTTPTRRSSTRRSRTPELSVTGLTAHLKSTEEEVDIDRQVTDVSSVMEQVRSNRKRKKMEQAEKVKDVASATEEMRSIRQQQKGASPRSDVKKDLTSALDLGEPAATPSFQFAAPTPLARLQTNASMVPASGVSSFIFSPPLSRVTDQGASATMSPHRQTRNQSAVGGRDVSLAPEPVDVADPAAEGKQSQESEGAGTSTTTGSKRARRATTSRKTKKTAALPSASPSDSPINLLSPGEAEAGTVAERGSSLPKRSSSRQAAGPAAGVRILRKRKVKLW